MAQRKDRLWKVILEDLIVDFLQLMHPDEADKEIDFSRPVVPLDKEFASLFSSKEGKLSSKIVDKLFKVHTYEGKEHWALIHCEVQERYDVGFPKRMYTYYNRIYDKYDKQISAYAILIDNSMQPRPNNYETKFLGTKLVYTYNVYQIALQDEEMLRKSDNPFAMVALAVQAELKNKGRKLSDAVKREIKNSLMREFLMKGFSTAKTYAVMRFIHLYMPLDDQNRIVYEDELGKIIKEEKTMNMEELFLKERTKEIKRHYKKIGKELGKELGIKQVVLNMLHQNLSDEQIVQYAGVSQEYVSELRASMN
jgi:hypothetical protein